MKLLLGALLRWPLYASDEDVSKVFRAFAARNDLGVALVQTPYCDTAYEAVIECGLGKLTVWNVNYPYAWASDGTFEPADGSPKMVWREVMPSRLAMWRLLRKIGGRPTEQRVWRRE